MKRVKQLIYNVLFSAPAILITLAVIASCNKESDTDEDAPTNGQEFTFYASWAHDGATKNIVDEDDYSILWSPQTRIYVWSFEYGMTIFTSTNTEPVERATFKGFFPDFDPNNTDVTFYASTFDFGLTQDNLQFHIHLPAQQSVSDDSEASGFPAFAITKDESLVFKNVLGGVRFSVTDPDITRVEIVGNKDELLTGEVSFFVGEDRIPYDIKGNSYDGSQPILTIKPKNGKFKPGKAYYVGLIPQTLNSGISFLLYKDDPESGLQLCCTKSLDKEIVVKRSVWGQVLDINGEFTPGAPSTEVWYQTIDGNPIESSHEKRGDYYIYPTRNFSYNKDWQYNPFENDKDRLKAVILPNGLESIGEGLFMGYNNLTYVALPGSLKKIGKNAFKGCVSLTNVNLPESVKEVGDYAFDGVKAEVFNSFIYAKCSENATEAHIPNTVKEITAGAFMGCAGLTSVSIPMSVEKINTDAFRNCTGLTNVALPESLTWLGASTFEGCTKLEGVNIPQTISVLMPYTFDACSSLKQISIPDSVKEIMQAVFLNCTALESINGGQKLESIQAGAFQGCSSLKTISLPASLTTLGSKAFYGCKNLTEFTIPSGLSVIESSTFEYCEGLKAIDIPSNITSVKDYAFRFCTSLKDIKLPSTITELGGVFSYCTALEEVNIPGSVYSLEGTFLYCSSLKKVTLNEGTAELRQTFERCTALESITIPESMLNIKYRTFMYCEALKKITLPSGFGTLGSQAFQDCNSLEEVDLKNVYVIESMAFNWCQNLKRVIIRTSTVPMLSGSAHFNNCPCSVYVPDGAVDKYKASWADYAEKILPLSSM